MFENIRNIDPSDEGTWADKVFITFDLEWANDDVLGFVLDILEESNVKATLFVTHVTPLLDRMRGNPNLELGVHPNFNYLLEGDFRLGRHYREVVEHYVKIVPEAVSIRCHALAQQTSLLNLFSSVGLKYDCNLLLPLACGSVRPFLHFDGKLIRVPFIWEDDVHLLTALDWNLETYLRAKSIRVFNFHPIHVFLNSENLERYSGCKKEQRDTKVLERYRNKTEPGVYDCLIDVINMCKESVTPSL